MDLSIKMEKKMIKLCNLNPHLVCLLCAGYFVETTTIVECLHTFCKSCIVRYLQSHKHCPTCGILIHETEPLSKLKLDRTMQDIMEKLLPHVSKDEMKRKTEFYENIRSEQRKKDKLEHAASKLHYDFTQFSNSPRNDEQINIDLEIERESTDTANEPRELLNKFIRCSSRSKISHLKKLLSKFYEQFCETQQLLIKCDGILLEDTEHMRHVFIVHWKRKPQPMVLHYSFQQRSLDMEDIVRHVLTGVVEKISASEEVETFNKSSLEKGNRDQNIRNGVVINEIPSASCPLLPDMSTLQTEPRSNNSMRHLTSTTTIPQQQLQAINARHNQSILRKKEPTIVTFLQQAPVNASHVDENIPLSIGVQNVQSTAPANAHHELQTTSQRLQQTSPYMQNEQQTFINGDHIAKKRARHENIETRSFISSTSMSSTCKLNYQNVTIRHVTTRPFIVSTTQHDSECEECCDLTADRTIKKQSLSSEYDATPVEETISERQSKMFETIRDTLKYSNSVDHANEYSHTLNVSAHIDDKNKRTIESVNDERPCISQNLIAGPSTAVDKATSKPFSQIYEQFDPEGNESKSKKTVNLNPSLKLISVLSKVNVGPQLAMKKNGNASDEGCTLSTSSVTQSVIYNLN